MQPIKQAVVNYSQMAIIEKYETVIHYLYPIAQSLPRKHGVVRDMFLQTLFNQAELFYIAGNRKFFPSVDHDILKAMIKRKIKCEKTCLIIDQLLFSQGAGIPIGSLTSQLFANIYGSKVDSFIHHELKHRRWARYMDDVVILGDDPERLRNDFYRIEEFSKENLKLSISRWQCSSVKRGINFLGYRIWNTHKLIRKDSVLRAKHKIQCFIENNEIINLTKFLASWRGHASWADTHNLFNWLDNKYDYANY